MVDAVEYRPCRADHLRCIAVQDGQQIGRANLLTPEYAAVIDASVGLSAWVGTRCIAAAGIVSIFPHRASAWALLAHDVRRYMVPLTYKVRRFLELDPTPRIELTVRDGFEPGHRWALAIGMTKETGVLRRYGLNGEDEHMYVRIR